MINSIQCPENLIKTAYDDILQQALFIHEFHTDYSQFIILLLLFLSYNLINWYLLSFELYSKNFEWKRNLDFVCSIPCGFVQGRDYFQNQFGLKTAL